MMPDLGRFVKSHVPTDSEQSSHAYIAQRDAALRDAAALRQALAALVAKLLVMAQPVNACVAMSSAHGFPYEGPTWEDEMVAARALLATGADPTDKGRA